MRCPPPLANGGRPSPWQGPRKRALIPGFCGRRHPALGLGKPFALTRGGGSGRGVRKVTVSIVTSQSQGVRGSPARAVRQPIKLRQLPRGHAKARSRLPGDQSRLRAVKRATVGGWMTARWSGVFHECSAETPRSQDPQLGRRRVFPRAIDQVSKSGASAGARNANVGCRNEFEASWRCVQVEPRGETSSSAERR